MKPIKITLTQFCNYISKTGKHRYNAAKSIMRELHSDYKISTDYWGPLRSRIAYVLGHSGKATDLDVVLESVSEDKKENYKAKVDGIKKFWKKKKFTKISINKRVWKHKNLRINVSPEMCFAYRDRIYVVKLFYSSKGKTITKNEADILLEIMRDTLDLDPKEVTLGVLDVSRGKLFQYSNTSDDLLLWVKFEAESLCKFLEDIEKHSESLSYQTI